MTTHPSGYDTASAMWAAVQARSKSVAKTTGTTPQKLQRQFVYDRFLARLFTSAPEGTWVLKGGTALLARVRSARHSRGYLQSSGIVFWFAINFSGSGKSIP